MEPFEPPLDPSLHLGDFALMNYLLGSQVHLNISRDVCVTFLLDYLELFAILTTS